LLELARPEKFREPFEHLNDIMQCLNNLLLNTDSYKASHWLQYPPGTDATFFYVESRGGLYDRTLFYGLQATLKEYLVKPITHADVDEAVTVLENGHLVHDWTFAEVRSRADATRL
jgi:nicotinic acid phosphoribosyltransferase